MRRGRLPNTVVHNCRTRSRERQIGANLGSSVAGLGDLNGDGYADVAVGAPHHNGDLSNEGAAFVAHGGAAGITSSIFGLMAFHEGNQSVSYFGATVAAAGDVNGDGFADWLAGAPKYSGPQTGEGSAFLYLSNTLGRPSRARTARRRAPPRRERAPGPRP